MSVRAKLALTILVTGALAALGVIATVLLAFQRFEHEMAYQRADMFLQRVVQRYDNLVDMHQRQPEEFNQFLRNLVLFEPDTQLYLLDATGLVLSSTGSVRLPPGFRVALAPVQQAASGSDMPYVMGDDPERMNTDTVIAARALHATRIAQGSPVSGYLYLVCHHPVDASGRLRVFGSTFAGPALLAVVAVVLGASLLAAWIIATVTRPLRQLTQAAASLSREGLASGAPGLAEAALPAASRDEFGQLTQSFRDMLATLRRQWTSLRRLDHFRREGVSNLSHDLRSPLTATVACLETLESRWAGDAQRGADQALVAMALRNTRNAARLVQSLGDLAQLDEPEFQLRTEVLDVGELLDDIGLRFEARAAAQGVALLADAPAQDCPAPVAAVDIELIERAVANLVDNALKFSANGGRIVLSACRRGGQVEVRVADSGTGIAPADLPHLFDRFYQSRATVAPATGEGGKGLGLAIVKRIAELHGGSVSVHSTPGEGTQVILVLPAAGLPAVPDAAPGPA